MYSRSLAMVVAALLVLVTSSRSVAQPVRVSVATDGTPANNHCFLPAMSATGRFVAFTSFASNLVAGDTNDVQDVFLRDRDTDADGVFDEPGAVSTIRVSQMGTAQANGPSFHPVVTPDGRYVFFESAATNFYSSGQPPLPFTEVLRWDRLSGAIVLVSRNDAGEPLNARSFWPAPTDDGAVVYFITIANNGPATAGGGVLIRRDIAAGTSTAVAFGTAGTIDRPSVSGDGRVLAYTILPASPTGGTIVVQALGEEDRVFAGAFGQVSHDGAFLSGILYTGDSGGPAFRIHLRSGERRQVGGTNLFSVGGSGASPSGRYVQGSEAFYGDFVYGSWTANFFSHGVVAFDGLDHWLVYEAADLAPQRGFEDLLAVPVATFFDNDEDGLNDHWELAFGLSPASATGDAGADGDPDHDGLTNAQELAAGSNPVGTQKRFLAEGVSSPDFFSTRIAIVNPGSVEARVAVRFDAGDGVGKSRALVVPARTRVTLDSHAEQMDGFSFSTVVDGDQPLVVDRLVSWGTTASGIYGSHAETSTAAPGPNWLLAEGSTVLGFQLFYLLQNPGDAVATATVRFLRPSGPPLVRTYQLAPRSRTTLYVNTVAGLESTDVSAEITATQPIAVERAMYRSAPEQPFALGHDAAAVAAPSTSWFFGEGATGAFFDTFLLLANPSAQNAVVQVEYLRDGDGAVTRTYTVPANSRFSVYVDGEPGMAATAFGTRVTSSVPIVAERAMYWPGGFFDYYEGHDSAGATQTGSHWVLAEGEEAGPNQAHTFVLIANTSSTPVSVRVRTLPETGPAEASDLLQIAGNARLTFPLITFRGFLRGGVDVVEEGSSTGALVVEGSMYWNAAGRVFGAGANWPATRIP